MLPSIDQSRLMRRFKQDPRPSNSLQPCQYMPIDPHARSSVEILVLWISPLFQTQPTRRPQKENARTLVQELAESKAQGREHRSNICKHIIISAYLPLSFCICSRLRAHSQQTRLGDNVYEPIPVVGPHGLRGLKGLESWRWKAPCIKVGEE